VDCDERRLANERNGRRWRDADDGPVLGNRRPARSDAAQVIEGDDGGQDGDE
jgi:hypothetical protein